MTHRQVDGIDLFNFPDDFRGEPLLAWMGDDYAKFIANELLERFRKQDDQTQMLGVKCESRPEIVTRVHEVTGKVSRVSLTARLQLLMRDRNDNYWRLRGIAELATASLGTNDGSSTVGFEIESSEAV